MGVLKNSYFWPIKEKIDGKIKVVLQGNEIGASDESIGRFKIFTNQLDIITKGPDRINSRAKINKSYKPTAVIIGKLKDADRYLTDGAIEYLSEDNFIFRVFMHLNHEENKFILRDLNHCFDIYMVSDVCHDNVVLMNIDEQENGIVYHGSNEIENYCYDKLIQDINDGDNKIYLPLLENMEKDILKITVGAEKLFEKLFNDETREIFDITGVAACEFADASLKRQQGLCIEYVISSEDIFQTAYTSHQLRVLESGEIDGVGIHI